MSLKEVSVVRIYITEGHLQINKLLKKLKDWEHIHGVTVFRGISGFGDSGVIHQSTIIDILGELPLVIEFFDNPEKVEETIAHLNTEIKPGHILTWPAKISV
jgi:PII-like signaling protein